MPTTGTVRFDGPFGGLNTLMSPVSIPPGELLVARNVWSKSGRIYPRPGWKNKDSATDSTATSYFSAYSQDIANGLGGGYKKSWVILQQYFPNAAADTFRVWQTGTSLSTASKLAPSGITFTGYRATYIKAGSWVIICDGGDTSMTKIASDGSHTDRPAGFPFPTGVATIGTGTGGAWGNLTGVFTYRFTFYDSTNGYESAPSPESHVASCTTQGTYPNGSVDALPTGADKYRLYRRRVGAALIDNGDGTHSGDGVGASDSWYLVGEYPSATLYHTGTCQTDGAPTTLRAKLAAGASAVNDVYNGMFFTTTGGTGSGQTREVADYDGTTKILVPTVAFNPTPDNTTTYEIVYDNLNDEELGDAVPLNNYQPNSSLSFTTRDPIYCTYHRNRAFYAKNDNTVWFSETPNPITDTTEFPSAIYVGDDSFFTIPTGQSEYITGLWSYGRALMVFTNNRVFVVDTDPLPDSVPIVTELVGATGTECFWSIQQSPPASDRPGVMFWIHRSGIQMFNGATTVTISRVPLDSQWPSVMVNQALYQAASYIDEDRLLYVVFFPTVTTPAPTENAYCYSIADGAMTSWLLYPSDTTYGGGCFFKTYDATGAKWSRIYGCIGNKHIVAMDSSIYTTDSQYTDGGTSFTWAVTFKDFVATSATHKSTFGLFRVAFDDAPASALSLNCSIPGSTFTPVTRVPTFATTGGYGINYATCNVGITADRCRLALTGTMAGATDLYGITGYALDVTDVGR